MSGMPAFDGPTDRRTDGPFVDPDGPPDNASVGPRDRPLARLSDNSTSRPSDRSPARESDHPVTRPSDRRTVGPPEPTIIAVSPAMRRAVELARRFAPLDLPILLVGETGTGKEVLAQAIHQWSGRRGELVDVDCGTLAPGMAVAELFGHRRGAYTTAVDSRPGLLEQASGGTLFLDELASLAPEGQAALLRVLETGQVRRVGDRGKHPVEFRLVAAVLEDVGKLRQGEMLRKDLYHRLAGTVIHLPPLRARPEDLLPLARHLAADFGRPVSDSAQKFLERHSWPGNVRELRYLIVRAASLGAQDIDAAALAEAQHREANSGSSGEPAPGERGAVSPEIRLYLDLCRRHRGRPRAIAAELGVSRATLYRRLQELGLTVRGLAAMGRLGETL